MRARRVGKVLAAAGAALAMAGLAGCGRTTPTPTAAAYAQAGLQRWQRARFDLTRAAANQEQVVAKSPRSAAGYARLGQIMAALSHPRAALALAQHALALDPQSSTLQDNVGLLALTAGNWTLAEAAYAHAVKAHPANWLALDGLAAVAVHRAAWPQAERDLSRAALLGGPQGATYDEWGRLLLAERQPAAARGYFQSARRVSPGWWQPLYDLARADVLLHHPAAARREAEAALSLDPAAGPAVVLLLDLGHP